MSPLVERRLDLVFECMAEQAPSPSGDAPASTGAESAHAPPAKPSQPRAPGGGLAWGTPSPVPETPYTPGAGSEGGGASPDGSGSDACCVGVGESGGGAGLQYWAGEDSSEEEGEWGGLRGSGEESELEEGEVREEGPRDHGLSHLPVTAAAAGAAGLGGTRAGHEEGAAAGRRAAPAPAPAPAPSAAPELAAGGGHELQGRQLAFQHRKPAQSAAEIMEEGELLPQPSVEEGEWVGTQGAREPAEQAEGVQGGAGRGEGSYQTLHASADGNPEAVGVPTAAVAAAGAGRQVRQTRAVGAHAEGAAATVAAAAAAPSSQATAPAQACGRALPAPAPCLLASTTDAATGALAAATTRADAAAGAQAAVADAGVQAGSGAWTALAAATQAGAPPGLPQLQLPAHPVPPTCEIATSPVGLAPSRLQKQSRVRGAGSGQADALAGVAEGLQGDGVLQDGGGQAEGKEGKEAEAEEEEGWLLPEGMGMEQLLAAAEALLGVRPPSPSSAPSCEQPPLAPAAAAAMPAAAATGGFALSRVGLQGPAGPPPTPATDAGGARPLPTGAELHPVAPSPPNHPIHQLSQGLPAAGFPATHSSRSSSGGGSAAVGSWAGAGPVPPKGRLFELRAQAGVGPLLQQQQQGSASTSGSGASSPAASPHLEHRAPAVAAALGEGPSTPCPASDATRAADPAASPGAATPAAAAGDGCGTPLPLPPSGAADTCGTPQLHVGGGTPANLPSAGRGRGRARRAEHLDLGVPTGCCNACKALLGHRHECQCMHVLEHAHACAHEHMKKLQKSAKNCTCAHEKTHAHQYLHVHTHMHLCACRSCFRSPLDCNACQLTCLPACLPACTCSTWARPL